ncbi:MAG: hypothetical protein RDU89_07110 [bacterium]|nr:hypothetical protein [bacterium]
MATIAVRAAGGNRVRVLVRNGYDIKDALRARGFKFDGLDKAWVAVVDRSDLVALAKEIRFAEGLGARMEARLERDPWTTLIVAFEDILTRANWREFIAALAGITLYDYDHDRPGTEFGRTVPAPLTIGPEVPGNNPFER